MKKITNVGIIGRGAIGSLYGSLLQNHHLQTMCFIVDEKESNAMSRHLSSSMRKKQIFLIR